MDHDELPPCEHPGCEKKAVLVYTDGVGRSFEYCVKHYNDRTGKFNFKFETPPLPGIKPR
jgi:hypothetical protein